MKRSKSFFLAVSSVLSEKKGEPISSSSRRALFLLRPVFLKYGDRIIRAQTVQPER